MEGGGNYCDKFIYVAIWAFMRDPKSHISRVGNLAGTQEKMLSHSIQVVANMMATESFSSEVVEVSILSSEGGNEPQVKAR